MTRLLHTLLAADAPSFAVIHREHEPVLDVLVGDVVDVDRLADIPLDGAEVLALVPFRQVRERGFAAHDDGAPIRCLVVRDRDSLGVDEAIAVLPRHPVVVGDLEVDVSDADYAAVVRRVIDDEIGRGEGANFVIRREFTGSTDAAPAEAVLGWLRQLLEHETGAHWTFALSTPGLAAVGATPERHVSSIDGVVSMNPISGTFRLKGLTDPRQRKQRLLEFLADEKEIYELFMVVDEELKMMCDICHEGGQVLGPFLKPMTHLVHTEYLLAGRTDRDVREVLRDTMYAATVTGSPVENACRLIRKYEPEGRGYYGSALALLGRDTQGRPTADSPIVIRTADVALDGRLKVTAGATLVRDSEATYEVAETHAKAGGILSAFGLVEQVAPAAAEGLDELARDEDVVIALGSRNQRLSHFWLTDQGGSPPAPELKGKQVVILDGEDDFVNMLRHLLSVMGMTSSVVRHEDVTPEALDGYDLVIVGPGPGDPRDGDHPKIATFRAVVDELLERRQPFLAVCLGHQVLCSRLGIDLAFKDIVFQGTQSRVDLGSAAENVGFYNTFVGRVGGDLPDGVSVHADPLTGDVHLVEGPHFRGIQFHAESILTEHGYDLVHDLVLDLLHSPDAG